MNESEHKYINTSESLDESVKFKNMIQMLSLDFLFIYVYMSQVYVCGTVPRILKVSINSSLSLNPLSFVCVNLVRCQISFKDSTDKSLLHNTLNFCYKYIESLLHNTLNILNILYIEYLCFYVIKA